MNERTLYERGKLKQVEHQMEKYKLDILGVSEVRWLGFGEQRRTMEGFSCTLEEMKMGITEMV